MDTYQAFDLVNSHEDQLKVFGILTFNWFLLYFIVHNTFYSTKLNHSLTLDTKNRIVSIVHGILSFVMASYEYLHGDLQLPNNQFQNFICIFSLSYSLYDTIACNYYGLADTGLYIHHIFCLIGFGTPLYYKYGALIALGGLFCAEASNFPMHLRVIFRSYGLKYTKSYQYSENIYLLFYIVFRGFIAPIYLLYPSLCAKNSPIIVVFVCFSMTVQNFYYIYQMQRLIKRKIQNYREMSQKRIDYYWFTENKQIQSLSFYKTKTKTHIF